MRNGHLLFSHTSIDIPILHSGTYWMTFHLHTYQVKKERKRDWDQQRKELRSRDATSLFSGKIRNIFCQLSSPVASTTKILWENKTRSLLCSYKLKSWNNALRHTKKLQLWKHNIERETGSWTNLCPKTCRTLLSQRHQPGLEGPSSLPNSLWHWDIWKTDSLKTLEDNEMRNWSISRQNIHGNTDLKVHPIWKFLGMKNFS